MSDPTPNIPSGIDRENPWPGLASFTEDSREFFFGREKETDELSRLVRRQTLTVLFGQSGLGKSSLLNAGLFPLLRETDHLPLYLRLDHSPSTPALAEQVKSALTAAFAAVKAEAPAFRPDETLWEYFHRKDVDIWSAKNRLLTPVLAFDQFEEIFTLGRADETCRERSRVFLAELACLVENRAPVAVQAKLDAGALDPAGFNFAKPSCQVILSLREDFLPDLEGLKQSMPALVHNRLRLKKLSGTQALEIVTKPAPHLLAEGVAEKIVEFVASARGGSAERLAELDVEPPLLSVICRELNDRRRALGQEKITADLVSGNRREILTDFYERSVADLPAPMRLFVEDHLLTKSGFRDNLALETALDFPGVTRPLLDTLVARRLLRIEDRLGLQRVELTHDVLADVVRNSRDQRQQRLALEEAREKEQLALAAAVRQARRQRLAIAGLVLAVVALGVGAAFGIRAQRRATEQAARLDLATGSRLLDEGKVGDGLAYLVNAARREPAVGAVASTRILSTLASRTFSLPAGPALKLPSDVDTLLFLAGGKSALLLGDDGRVRLLDVANWKIVLEYPFEQKVVSDGLRVAAKNPDVFAVAFENGAMTVCDTATGRQHFAPIAPPARAGAYSRWLLEQKIMVPLMFGLSPDGRWLRTIRHSWTLFDATSGEERAASDIWSEFLDSASTLAHFTPDGSRMVTIGGAITGSPGSWTMPNETSEFRSVPDGKVLATIPLAPGASTRRHVTMFSTDGKRMLMLSYATRGGAGGERTASVYNTEAMTVVGPPIPYSQAQVNQIWLTPDGNRVIISSDDRTITVYESATGKPAYAPLKHGGPAECVGISDDSAILATVSVDGLSRLWDLKTGTLAAESTFKQDRRNAAALSPDGRTLLVSAPSGLLHRLQLTRGAAAALVLAHRPSGQNTPAAPVLVQFAPRTPARLLWFEARHAKVFDVASGRWTEGGFPLPFFINTNTPPVRGPDGMTLNPGDPLIVRPLTGPRRAWIMGENSVAQNVELAGISVGTPPITMSVNGKFGLIYDRANLTATIWDLHSGQRAATIAGVNALTASALTSFSPDNRRVAIHELKTEETPEGLRVYEIASGKFLFKIVSDDKATFHAARFSSDGTRLLTGSSWGKVQVWDAASGKLLQSNQAHGFSVSRFDMSADGKRYASLSQEGTVQVWDSATNSRVGGLLVHTGAVTRAEFSGVNERLTTAAIDGSGRVWSIRSGLPLSDAGMELTGLAAHGPDERFLLTLASPTATMHRLWAAPPIGHAGRTPKWLLQLATICAGRRVNDEGKIVSAADEFDQLDDLRREIAALPEGDVYAEWARWFLSDSPARPIAPDFTITPAEAKKLTEEMGGPDRLIAMADRDNALLLAEKFSETEPLEREMLAWVRERDGEDGPYLHSHLVKISQSLLQNGKFEEAEKYARESFALREKNNARDSYPYQSARATIGSALAAQKRYAEAEPLLIEACEFFKKQAPQAELTNQQIKFRLRSLVELYEATGRPEKAAEWKAWVPKSAAP